MSFSKEDQAKAKKDRKVLVALFVNGKSVPGFPFQGFSRTEHVSPVCATSVIKAVEALFNADANPADATK
jgi:hypothetical protein